jgi:hypothetical protein
VGEQGATEETQAAQQSASVLQQPAHVDGRVVHRTVGVESRVRQEAKAAQQAEISVRVVRHETAAKSALSLQQVCPFPALLLLCCHSCPQLRSAMLHTPCQMLDPSRPLTP